MSRACRLLVPSASRYQEFLADGNIVDTVLGAEVDTKFAHALANPLVAAEVSELKPVDPLLLSRQKPLTLRRAGLARQLFETESFRAINRSNPSRLCGFPRNDLAYRAPGNPPPGSLSEAPSAFRRVPKRPLQARLSDAAPS